MRTAARLDTPCVNRSTQHARHRLHSPLIAHSGPCAARPVCRQAGSNPPECASTCRGPLHHRPAGVGAPAYAASVRHCADQKGRWNRCRHHGYRTPGRKSQPSLLRRQADARMSTQNKSTLRRTRRPIATIGGGKQNPGYCVFACPSRHWPMQAGVRRKTNPIWRAPEAVYGCGAIDNPRTTCHRTGIPLSCGSGIWRARTSGVWPSISSFERP